MNSESWQKSVSSLPTSSTLKFLMNGHSGDAVSNSFMSHLDASASKQVNTLLYCLEEEAESILKSTKITEEETKNYETVLEKFDGLFQVRRNILFERAHFNRRCQLPGESMEEYIVKLYNLVKHCTQLRGLDPRPPLVGILDKTLSECLQLDPALTLEKAKQMIYQHKNSSRCSKELEKTVWKRCIPPETKNTRRHGKPKNR